MSFEPEYNLGKRDAPNHVELVQQIKNNRQNVRRSSSLTGMTESTKHRLGTKMLRRGKVGIMPNHHNDVSARPSHSSASYPDGHPDEEPGKHGRFTRDEIKEYKAIFSMFDTDGSGAIGSEELKDAIKSIGLQANDEDIDKLIREVDEDGNGEIDFEEFCLCMKKSQSLAKSTNEEIIRQCFEIFDQDGNGVITENEFKYIAKEIGGFSDELAEYVFHELDISSIGHLTADQFAAIVEDYMLCENNGNNKNG